ncbi:hypothetical protein BDY19DRAFT_894826 [Irpex rosettiformis]|uniref:Uncharacterized protein n=1 Tax=Irpex rosettiformis TaxID=378272 RepID=A0ACB8TWW8_9APHY|nr:hypothetical protein BDY19DRAFT_894826 [Irpex rosettiformis]
MSAVTKLQSPLKELVAGATHDGSSEFGRNEKDKKEVEEWIERVAGGEVVKAEALKDLEAQLVPKTYVVSNYFTAADVALYGALHPIFAQLQPPQYYAQPALTRYFDHIQNQPTVRKSADALAPAFSLVQFDLENAPKIERKADPPKEKKKKAEGAPLVEKAASSSNEKSAKKEKNEKPAPVAPAEGAVAEAKEGKSQKKEKKEKKPAEEGSSSKKGGKSAPAAAEDAGDPVPSMIDLRVGHIVDVMKHPDADGLYVEQIDFGEETGPRTVVSGLVHYIPIEDMRDKYLVGVCNLKPANMRGIKSFAMVLAATSKDGKDAGIELIQPPAGSRPGDRVYFEGAEFESAKPLSQLNPKKKIFETVQPGFTTLETKEAAWVNPATKSVHKIRTDRGVCAAPTLVGASLS